MSSNYQQPKYYRDEHGNVFDERGALLPFLAGVLVTTPFIFFAKNNNQQPYPPPYPPYPPQAPVYYPMYQQQPYPPYPYGYPR